MSERRGWSAFMGQRTLPVLLYYYRANEIWMILRSLFYSISRAGLVYARARGGLTESAVNTRGE
jgi:hypothetical protein